MITALVLVALVGALSYFVWYVQTAKLRRCINQIPGPPAMPLLGNAHQMTTGPGKKLFVVVFS